MTLSRRGFLWAVAAFLGIAVAAALTWSVSRLAGQRIGLAYTPLSAIHRLAPRRAASADAEPAKSAARGASRQPKKSRARSGGAVLGRPTAAASAVSSTAIHSTPAAAFAPSRPSMSRTSMSSTGSSSSSGGDHSDSSGGGRSSGGGSGGSPRDD